MRIRLGVKTAKNQEFPENSDRLLIGVDPSMNDWLYTPDPFIAGEFGSVLLLADGTEDNRYGSKAAHLVAYTVRQLFDELIELPPDDDSILRLLERFFTKANQQVLLKIREVPEWSGYACSTGLCLLHNFKAYIVWAGDIKIYKYSKFGVPGSFPQRLENLEQVNADHSIDILQALGIDTSDLPHLPISNLYTYHGQQHESFSPGKVVIPLEEDSIIMMCSATIAKQVKEKQLQDILDNHDEIDIVTEEIFAHLQEQFVQASDVSVLGVQILNGPSPINPRRLKIQETKEKTAKLLNQTLPLINDSASKLSSDNAEVRNISEPTDITPMRVRTVLPNEDHVSELKYVPQAPPKSKQSESLGIPSKATEKESSKLKQDQQNRKDQFLQKISPIIKRETPKESVEIDPGTKGKPRIMATAYPDPDWETKEKPVLQDNNQLANSELDQKEEVAQLEESEIQEDILDPHPTDIGITKADDSVFNNTPQDERELLYLSLDDEDDEPIDYNIEAEEEDVQEDTSNDTETPIEDNHEDGLSIVEAQEENDETEVPLYKLPIDIDTIENSDQGEGTFEKEIEKDPSEIITELEGDFLEQEKHQHDPEHEVDADPIIEDHPIHSVTITQALADADPIIEEQLEEPIINETVPKIVHKHDEYFDREQNETPSPKKETLGHKVTESSLPKSAEPWIEQLKKLNIRIILAGAAVLILILWGLSSYWGEGDYAQLELDKPAVTLPKEESPTEKQPRSTPPTDKKLPVEEKKELNPSKEESKKQESEAPVVPPKKEKEEKVAEKTEIIKAAPPVEPEYDERIKANKQQLKDQVSALMAEKNKLCKQIDTYSKNAPSRKLEMIKLLQYDCDQMSKKFQSIYDSKTGFFNTVRYDLLTSTLQNIQHSVNQTEKKFLDIRSE